MKHARYYSLLLAEGHLTRRLFGAMLRKVAARRQYPEDKGRGCACGQFAQKASLVGGLCEHRRQKRKIWLPWLSDGLRSGPTCACPDR